MLPNVLPRQGKKESKQSSLCDIGPNMPLNREVTLCIHRDVIDDDKEMYCIGKALDPRYQETASDISSNEK
jgi:hypothetical protein